MRLEGSPESHCPPRRTNSGAVDAEQAERSDNRRNAAENDDGGCDTAEQRADQRAYDERQQRTAVGAEHATDGDGREPHDDADRDIDTAHGEQQGHAKADQQQLDAVAQDRGCIA